MGEEVKEGTKDRSWLWGLSNFLGKIHRAIYWAGEALGGNTFRILSLGVPTRTQVAVLASWMDWSGLKGEARAGLQTGSCGTAWGYPRKRRDKRRGKVPALRISCMSLETHRGRASKDGKLWPGREPRRVRVIRSKREKYFSKEVANPDEPCWEISKMRMRKWALNLEEGKKITF